MEGKFEKNLVMNRLTHIRPIDVEWYDKRAPSPALQSSLSIFINKVMDDVRGGEIKCKIVVYLFPLRRSLSSATAANKKKFVSVLKHEIGIKTS